MKLLVVWVGLGCSSPVDMDRDGYPDTGDCAPEAPASHPGAWEVCDGADNDCDGAVDEGYDLDGDGYLADDAGCRIFAESVDCDDLDPSVNPGVAEICDGRDEDCSGVVDDALDADEDGYGACEDCDDTDPFIHPEAAEACDGLDNDCDRGFDEDWDEDGDGVAGCMGDCDDEDPMLSPDIPEACDDLDNDCDGRVDEGFDLDGDGWQTCRGDCDDQEAAVYPGAEEICDDLDNDCDAETSELEDRDEDGYSLCAGDCDDRNVDVFPGAAEFCDGADNDCNGLTDEFPECFGCVEDDGLLVCTNSVTQDEAVEACVALGASLIVLPTVEENAAVSGLVSAWTSDAYWLHLDDAENEGEWIWGDGSALDYSSAWNSGEPNDHGGGEDCVHANYGGVGLWNDISCSATYPFVCEP